LSSKEPSSSKPDLYVVARIIQALRQRDSVNKTALATSTGLAYDKLVRYLAWMSEKGFVEVSADGSVTLTDAGQKAYDELVTWILKNVGKLKFPRIRMRT
jgi:predicted transcriptional regulator